MGVHDHFLAKPYIHVIPVVQRDHGVPFLHGLSQWIVEGCVPKVVGNLLHGGRHEGEAQDFGAFGGDFRQ